MTFALLALLFFKHFLADFLMQFEYMLREKGTYGAYGGLEHSLLHYFGTLVVLLGYAHITDSVSIMTTTAVWLAMADGIIHYHIDWAKMNLSKGLTPANHKFWVWFGADQLLHYLTYLGIAYVFIS